MGERRRVAVDHVLGDRVLDQTHPLQQRRQHRGGDEKKDEGEAADREPVAPEAHPCVAPEADLLGCFPIDLGRDEGGRSHYVSLTRGSMKT